MNPKILVVDDSAFMRNIISTSLRKQDILDIEEATNGLEAVEKYKKNKYDFVTMDITMDEMNGLKALKEIKKIDPTAKIIMVSALSSKDVVLEAVKSGAIDFVVKPYNMHNIATIIKNKLK